MIEIIETPKGPSLDEYAASIHLANAVDELRDTAYSIVPKFAGRTLWMVNSTAKGGGVAEMLPRQVGIFDELGIETRWAVIGTHRKELFDLTKRLHNLLHGAGEPVMTDADRALYELVSRELQAEFQPMLGPDDVLMIHDPQPAGMGALIKRELDLPGVWRCHIGLDEDLPQTRAGWNFLRPYVSAYDRAVFTAPEYIPDFLADRADLVRPALDPYSAKNRQLRVPEVVEILGRSGLMIPTWRLLKPPFSHPAERLQADGTFGPATEPEDLGILYRPIVMEVSRWDRLKGWAPLVEGFATLKRSIPSVTDVDHRKVLEDVALLLVGPEPAAVSDDPEAVDVLNELTSIYRSLPRELQRDIALLSLPMTDSRENALMVNALQTAASVVVQNSVREGFGLTATEPMWKGTPVLVSSACGLRQQVRPGIEGEMIRNADDPDEIAAALDRLLRDPDRRATMARNAQRRVREEFLVFTQVRNDLRVLERALG
ncbi:MAG: glycosyltransferase [Actinomycetales bacterium]|nr:glycosyltransferase [Actinomycetales bacterium]